MHKSKPFKIYPIRNFVAATSVGILNDEKLLEPRLLQYKAKRQTPATAHQKERLREYREAHNITDPINWETLTRNEASRLYDNYRKNE